MFEYQPLPGKEWIRLVTIHPDLQDGNIACSLEQFDGSSCPPYTALSYRWGHPDPQLTVLVNGVPRRIHGTLWQYLRRAREDGNTAHHWIDFLCLDQEDHLEKSEQVPRMGDIYWHAEHVMAWLGDDEAGIDALRLFRELSHDDDDDDAHQFPDPPLDPRSPVGKRALLALSRLLEGEPYWGRVWIIQEVLCSKDCAVVCGTVSMAWTDLLKSVISTICRVKWGQSRTVGMWWSHQIFVLADLRTKLHRGDVVKVWNLCERLSERKSGRWAVDRIYGLVGLAGRFDPAFDHRLLDVNYDKPLEYAFWDVIFMRLYMIFGEERARLLIEMPTYLVRVRRSVFDENWDNVLCHLRGYIRANTTQKDRRHMGHVALQTCQALLSGLRHLRVDNHGWLLSTLGPALISHACRHMRATEPWRVDEAHVWGRIIGLSLLAHCDLRSRPQCQDTREECLDCLDNLDTTWLCASHLPNRVPRRQIMPATKPLEASTGAVDAILACSAGGSEATGCDDASRVLEMKELGLDVQIRRTSRPGTAGLGHELHVFCSWCHCYLECRDDGSEESDKISAPYLNL